MIQSHALKKIIKTILILATIGIFTFSYADPIITTTPTTTTTAKPKLKHHPKTHKLKVTKSTTAVPTLAPATAPPPASTISHDPALQANTVHERVVKERQIPNKFAIAFYKPTYVIPYYYTFSPDNAVYQNNTPHNEELKNNEIKYQLSFKVPLWRNIFNYPSSLFFAYTQMSYWQAYNKYAFFRETDYEPEVYLANELDWHLIGNWRLNFINLGAVHQSNGFGNSLERSWNRVYLKAVLSSEHWFITYEPWIIIHDSLYETQNPNMSTFMGHEELLVACRYNNVVVSLESRNLIESGGRRSGNMLSVSFPLTKYLNGYVQAFTGYGQSLIEYNHRTNSLGVGFSLSNWA